MKLIATIILALAIHHASAVEHLIGMGPELQGVWVTTASSEDKGKTISHNEPVAVARVTATRIIMPGNEENRVLNVYFLPPKGEDREEYIVELATGTWLNIVRVGGDKNYMVIVSPGLGEPETSRYLIHIE